MLTPEQIKDLKPGDPIVINASFLRVDTDGDIRFNAPSENGSQYEPFISPSFVSLPSEHGTSVPTPEHAITFCHVVDNMVKPKCDPSRPFRKGDIVKRRTVDGRTDPDVPEDIYLAVTTDETEYGNVRVQEPNGRSVVTKWVFLELVSPMEEREPFYLDEITDEDEDEEQYHFFMIKTRKGEDKIRTYYSNKFETIAQVKAAAEAECDRLNAEWRKAQNYD